MQFSYVYDDRVFVYCCSGVECHESTTAACVQLAEKTHIAHTTCCCCWWCYFILVLFSCVFFFFLIFLNLYRCCCWFFPYFIFLDGLCFIPLNLWIVITFSRFVYLLARLHYSWVSHHRITTELIESSVLFSLSFFISPCLSVILFILLQFIFHSIVVRP